MILLSELNTCERAALRRVDASEGDKAFVLAITEKVLRNFVGVGRYGEREKEDGRATV